jgi:hypothetical protein
MKFLWIVSAIAIGVYVIAAKPDKRGELNYYFQVKSVNLGLVNVLDAMNDQEIDFLYEVIIKHRYGTGDIPLPAAVIDGLHNLELKYNFSFS